MLPRSTDGNGEWTEGNARAGQVSTSQERVDHFFFKFSRHYRQTEHNTDDRSHRKTPKLQFNHRSELLPARSNYVASVFSTMNCSNQSRSFAAVIKNSNQVDSGLFRRNVI